MIRALIFDMDGLMIDTEHLYWEVGRSIAAEYGKTISDQTLRSTMGRDRLRSCEILVKGAGLPIPAQELLDRREQMMLERFRTGGVRPMPGVQEILEQFRGRTKFAVATSSPRMLADAALPAIGVQHFFDAIVTGDQIKNGKPAPDIYLKAMERLDVDPGDSVVLEDATAGATAGKRAGAHVIAVPSPLTTDEDFSAVADFRADDLFGAAQHIESMMSR